MKPKYGLRAMLLDYLRANKVLNRKVAHAIAIQNHYEPATCERELRFMRHEIGVTPLNNMGVPANVEEHEHIVAWKYTPFTVFKKVCKKKKQKSLALSSTR